MNNLEKFKKILQNKNYSPRTIKTYIFYLEQFLSQQEKSPAHITFGDITKYLLHREYTGVSQQNQIIGALKLYAKYIMNRRAIHIDKIERPKKEKKLPLVLDGATTEQKIAAIPNNKHRALLSVVFSCALRVSELLALKPQHIDRNRMVINILGAKGKKDRIVPLSPKLLKLLEEYYRAYQPKEFLFEGQFGGQYTASSCNKLVKKYVNGRASMHTLRHTCATYLHEQGVDIASISKFLGHGSVKTTMIYIRVSNKTIKRLPVPIK